MKNSFKKNIKKFLISFLAFFSIVSPVQDIFAIEKNIAVSAIVWSIDVPSKIKITSPDYLDEYWAVEYIENWSSFALDFLITDNEESNIYFTVTSDIWAISVENWWPVSTTGWWYQEQFVFLAWSTAWIWEIVITSNDWVSVTSKKILVYIY